MGKLVKIFICIIILLSCSLSINTTTSEAASKPTKKEISSLEKKISKIPLKYGKKTVYLTVNVDSSKKSIFVTKEKIAHSSLKLIDVQHGKNNIKPLTNWASKAIPSVKKLAKKYNYSWNVSIINICDSYMPKTFLNKEVLDSTGSCGYSFPLIYADSNNYHYAEILYSYRYKINY